MHTTPMAPASIRLENLNMLTLSQLAEGLKEAGKRYAALHQLFIRFHTSLTTQLSEQAIPVEEPAPGALENGAFNLVFAGRTLRFRFYALSPDLSALQGAISCHLVHPDEPAKALLLHRFLFTETGQTDLANPDKADGGKLNISYHSDALHIVLHCIHLSLQQRDD
jgi:hypothetical protein